MTETLAERARAALRDHPFLDAALRAGVVNHAAAARFLGLADDADDTDVEAAATALRRYADAREAYAVESRDARVTMESGLGRVDGASEGPLAVNGVGFAPDEGSLTGILAAGDVDTAALAVVLERLALDDVDVTAAGVADGALLVVVGRRDGPDAVRTIEAALDAVPARA